MICPAVSTAMDKLAKAGLACPRAFQGCTREEIGVIESSFSVRLPQCYRDFLAEMGGSAGEFLLGYDYSYPKMLEFRSWAAELISECGSALTLPDNAFVYFFDPSEAFLYFHCDGNPDPPIFMFIETEPTPKKVFDSFSDWLLAVTDDHISIRWENDRLKAQRGDKDRGH